MAAGNGNGQTGRPHLNLCVQKKKKGNRKKINRKRGKTPLLDYKIEKITPKKNIIYRSKANTAHTAAQS